MAAMMVAGGAVVLASVSVAALLIVLGTGQPTSNQGLQPSLAAPSPVVRTTPSTPIVDLGVPDPTGLPVQAEAATEASPAPLATADVEPLIPGHIPGEASPEPPGEVIDTGAFPASLRFGEAPSPEEGATTLPSDAPTTAATTAPAPTEAASEPKPEGLSSDRVVVRVYSEPPGLDVQLDGRRRGRTPVKLMVNPGHYALTVASKGGEHVRKLHARAETRLCFRAEGPGEPESLDCAALGL